MKTIMFNSEKGGTGKTTLSTLAAAYLAAKGHRTLMLDIDPQAHATISFRLPKAPGLYNVLIREEDVIDNLVRPDASTYTNQSTGLLFVLPNNKESAAIPTLLENQKLFARMLDDVSDFIDVVVIDTAPGVGLLLGLVHIAADYVVVPTELQYLSLDGVKGTVDAALAQDTALLGIVPNKVKRNTLLHQHHLDELQTACLSYGWPMLDAIHDRIEWGEASTMRTAIYAIDEKMSSARREALRFAQSIERAVFPEAVKRV